MTCIDIIKHLGHAKAWSPPELHVGVGKLESQIFYKVVKLLTVMNKKKLNPTSDRV
jgi:hypothetical protein